MNKVCTLAPAGAGLPAMEALMIKRFVFPYLKVKLSHRRALELFTHSGEAILALASTLDKGAFMRPVLVKRLRGMEDSSRNWSVEFTLEHIQVVTAAALFIIRKLEAQETFELPVRTEDVKPSGGLGPDRLRAFRTQVQNTPVQLSQYHFRSPATHFHPWFGELTSLDWLRLIAFHQDLHRRQIECIVAKL